MKIYKEKQFLVFDFEDGKTVKYDFATKTAIGKKGKPVKNLKGQLQGLTIDELCECCTDKQYSKFLKFVKWNCSEYGCEITNIGTVLERVPRYSNFEQLYSAGFENVEHNFRYRINDIPKALRKICKKHNITLTNKFLELYNRNPDAYQLAYELEYESLDSNDIYRILTNTKSVKEIYGTGMWDYSWKDVAVFECLINEYNYAAKPLLNYIDYLKTFEAMDRMSDILGELYDYCEMMSKISNKFDKYPKHFLTTHKIACRNYNRLKEQFDEEEFKKHININMEKTFGDYKFIYPKSTQEIKNEAAQMNNCVASYIKKVLDNQCDILFLRYKDSPDKSLVTIEVRNGKIVQAKQKFNYPCNEEQNEVIARWNKWYSNKLNNESEEAEC
jgi:hypothetical protein